MFETAQEFLDYVDANGGPRQIMMLIFNNSYTKVYGKGEFFNPATDLDLTTGFFKFYERDVRRQEYFSIKALAYLEGITFAPAGVDKDTINTRNFRP